MEKEEINRHEKIYRRVLSIGLMPGISGGLQGCTATTMATNEFNKVMLSQINDSKLTNDTHKKKFKDYEILACESKRIDDCYYYNINGIVADVKNNKGYITTTYQLGNDLSDDLFSIEDYKFVNALSDVIMKNEIISYSFVSVDNLKITSQALTNVVSTPYNNYSFKNGFCYSISNPTIDTEKE